MFHDFPYTNFNELNLDYTLKKVNEFNERLTTDESLLNTLPSYVRDINIVNNASLKVKFGNDSEKSFALPSGNNFVLDITLHDPEDDNIYSMSVNDQVKYDCNNVTDYHVISDMIFNGIPSILRITSSNGVVTGIFTIQATAMPVIMMYDFSVSGSEAWKVFKVENDTTPYVYLTRII